MVDNSFPILREEMSPLNEDDLSDFNDLFWKFESNWLKGAWISGNCENIEYMQFIENSSIVFLDINLYNNSDTSRNRCQQFVLPHLPYLKKLSVECDVLDGFDDENFKNAPLLEELKLRRITQFPTNFTKAQNIRILDLSGNNVTTYSLILFFKLVSLPNLEYLDISRSTFYFLPERLPHYESIRVLNISLCNFRRFNGRTIMNLELLHTIDMSGNKIEYIENMIIPKSLRILILKNNILHEITFSSNINHALVILDISYNHLSTLPKFDQFISIGTLDLTQNNLNIINTSNCLVHSMNISKNNVQYWKNPKQYSFLRSKLNISRNVIPHLTETMKHSLLHLDQVDLEGNPFDCNDCEIKNLQSLMSRQKPSVSRNITCSSPAEKRGLLLENAVCIDPNTNFPLIVGVPGGLLIFVFIGILLIMYRYRFELVYIKHLYKLRAGRKKDSSDAIYDAFVCYSGNDRPWVLTEFAPMLEAEEERYRLCLHDRDFLLGSHITRNIVHSIDSSRRTIVVLSKQFVTSKWCQWELDMANHKMFEETRDFLILLERERLDRTILPRHLKYLMDTRTYLEWPDDADDSGETVKKKAIKRLKKALGWSLFQRKIKESQRLQDLD